MLELLKNAVIRLNKNGVSFIVIPCNTVHVFIKRLRKISEKPILSIIEECAEECKKRKIKKVGLLGTNTTIKQDLHGKELRKRNINVLIPEKQNEVSKVILNILNNKTTEKDKVRILEIIMELKSDGAEAVILGCTDLDILIKDKDSVLPLIDTTKVLENKVVEIITKNKGK